jgi:hypothetical protein
MTDKHELTPPKISESSPAESVAAVELSRTDRVMSAINHAAKLVHDNLGEILGSSASHQ